MYEPLLALYLCAVFILVIYLIRNNHLYGKTRLEDAQDKTEESRKILELLRKVPCPACLGKTRVESGVLFSANSALLICETETCKQRSIWKYDRKGWHLVTPHRITSSPIMRVALAEKEKEAVEEKPPEKEKEKPMEEAVFELEPA